MIRLRGGFVVSTRHATQDVWIRLRGGFVVSTGVRNIWTLDRVQEET